MPVLTDQEFARFQRFIYEAALPSIFRVRS
jgi:hypothetical protein